MSAAGTSASGMWMVTGTTRSPGAASIITGNGAPQRWARNSVWPGKAKPAPSFSAFLWIGLVQSAEARARPDDLDAARDDRDDRGGVRRVGHPRGRRTGERMVQDGKAARQGLGRGLGSVDGDDRHRQARAEAGHVRAVADQEERQPPAEGRPRLERDLAADPGGVAEGQRDRRGHRSTIRASPISSWR